MSTNTQAILKEVSQLMITTLKKALRDQGHYLTGTLERSLNSTVTKDSLTISGLYYLWILEKGVAPGRMVIGNKSITALTAYVQRRMGYDSKKAKSVAFAILKTQAKEGMPTHNAHRYSSTGRRTAALAESLKLLQPLIDHKIDTGIEEIIETEFHKQKTQII